MNIKIAKLAWILFAGGFLFIMAGCSSQPRRVDAVEDARALVQQVDRDPKAEEVAGAELEQAKEALNRADHALERDRDTDTVQHEAYLATRHAQIAQERIAEARAREQIEESEAERNRVLLQARTREAERAKTMAETNRYEAERQAMEAKRRAAEAELAREQADDAVAEARRLQDELETLKAEQTARGLVLTLSDVLFDTDQATLKPGAEITMNRLAAFMQDNPERNLLIEGHTDSRGMDAYNQSLSIRRADAVRTAMVARGIDINRLRTVGLGESYPVATNDTSAGRQQNRRVEIVVSDKSGSFPAVAEREVVSN